MQDVLNGTSTMEEAQQNLRNFQIDLINNVLKDDYNYHMKKE